MKKIYLLAFYIFTFLSISAQGYQKCIITDIKFLSRQTPLDTKESFPNYFVDQQFTDQILANVGSILFNKFQIQKIEYIIPDVIEYKYGSFGDRTRLKQYSKAPSASNIVFISIETIIQFASSIKGNTIYKLSTEINALDGKGNKVFKFKNTIPFMINHNDSISGQANISKIDLFNLYLDGIQATLEGKQKKLEKRAYVKPASKHYNDFLAKSEKFYMIPGDNIYSYGKDLNSVQKVLEFKYNIWRSIGSKISGDIIDSSNKLKEGYNLSNLFKKEDYVVKVTGGSTILFKALTIDGDFKIEFVKEKEKVGAFIVTEWNRIEGNFKGNNYSVVFKPEFNVQEIYKAEVMVAIINNTINNRTVYLIKDANEDDLGDLFNLVFAWDFTMALKQKAEAENRNN